jgi:hypothetical protein
VAVGDHRVPGRDERALLALALMLLLLDVIDRALHRDREGVSDAPGADSLATGPPA